MFCHLHHFTCALISWGLFHNAGYFCACGGLWTTVCKTEQKHRIIECKLCRLNRHQILFNVRIFFNVRASFWGKWQRKYVCMSKRKLLFKLPLENDLITIEQGLHKIHKTKYSLNKWDKGRTASMDFTHERTLSFSKWVEDILQDSLGCNL